MLMMSESLSALDFFVHIIAHLMKKLRNEEAQRLTFNVEDITHIIVKTESEVHHFVDAILGMKNIGGLDGMLADDDRKLLLTKIISQEKIEKDF